MTLAAMMLTAMTAWAQEVEIILRNDASQYVYCGYLNKVKPAVERVIYGENEIDGMYCTVSYGNNNRAGENAGSVKVTLPDSYGEGIEGIKYFTITKAPLTVTAGSDSKYYDGTPLTCNSYTVEGLVGNDTEFLGHYSATVTGSQTKVGTSANVPSNFTFGGYGYEANYDITYVPGTLTVTADPADWADNGDGSYTIGSEKGWDIFCDALQDNDTYNRFSGKTVYLDDDITVTRMAGSSYHDFCGTFLGQGHTLTFTSSENVYGVAPFSYISETTPTGSSEVSHPAIRNLNVVVDINTAATNAGGLVGRMWGTLTIEDCTVSGTIQTSNQFAAGFIAQQNGTANITGCVFDGKLLTTNGTNSCAGFVGKNGGTVSITNCLYAPADLDDGETWVGTDGSATFVRGNTPSLTNCYYTATLGTEQGTKAIAVNKGSEEVTPDYSTSGIKMHTDYMERDGILYAPDGASVTVGYVDETGTAHTHSATVLGGGGHNSNEVIELPGDWYVAGRNVNYGCGLRFENADTYLILADNASLTIRSGEPAAIYSYNNSVTIYAQANGTGSLTAENNSLGESGIQVYGSSLIINGGTINAQSPSPYRDIFVGSATLNGGTVNATSKGIRTSGGVTLAGATVTAKSYGSNPVTVADGFVYTDGNGHYYAGTLSDDEKTAIAGKTISPVATYSVSIADGITNGSVTVARSYAAAGENVILTVTPNTYYTVESVSYNDGSDHTITPVGDVYSFVMPAAAVTVSATFSTSISFDTATDVSYIDANGVAQTAPTVNLLTQTSTKLLAGWYMAASDVTIKGDVLFGGNIHLILKDGVTLTIEGKLGASKISFDDNFNIVGSDLTIYRQSDGTGCLNTSGILTKTVTINGGVVTSAADENGKGIIGNYIVINGGQVTATATGVDGTGIAAVNTITLGYSRADDFVHATSFNPVWASCTIIIKDGQTLTDGTNTYTHAPPSATLEALTNVTLRPYKEITLANDDNNNSAISNWNGGVAKVTLSDRTLYKDGNWNTLCLPFDVTDGNNTDDITFSGTPLAGATARTMTNAIISGSTLELTFGEEVTTMTAGVPYIIKWASGDNIVNPEFNYVTIKSALQPVVNGNIEFQGSYAPVSITAQEGDNTLLYLGAGNTLYWPNSPMTIGAQRAVFKLKGGITVGDPSDPNVHVRAFNLSFSDEDDVTGILSTTDDTDFTDSDDAWYDLSGRKLSGKPSQRGVYIHGGRKIAIQ